MRMRGNPKIPINKLYEGDWPGMKIPKLSASTRGKAAARRFVGTKKGKVALAVGGGALVLGAYEHSKRSSGRNGIAPNSTGGATGIYGV